MSQLGTKGGVRVGLTSFMLSMYRWEALSDQHLVIMKGKVDRGIRTAMDISVSTGQGWLQRSTEKDLDKLYESQRLIDAELTKRGLL